MTACMGPRSAVGACDRQATLLVRWQGEGYFNESPYCVIHAREAVASLIDSVSDEQGTVTVRDASRASSPVVPSVGAVPVEVPEEVIEAVERALCDRMLSAPLTDDEWAMVKRELPKTTERPAAEVAVRAAYPLIAARVRAEERQRIEAWLRARSLPETGLHDFARQSYNRALDEAADELAAGSAVPAIDCAPAGSDSGVADSDRMQRAARTSVPVANHRSAGRVAPQAGSAVPVATPGRVETATVAAQALMGVVGEIDDLTTAELVTRRAMQFEQEARDLTPVATPTEPDVEVVCPNCKATIRARMSDAPAGQDGQR